MITQADLEKFAELYAKYGDDLAFIIDAIQRAKAHDSEGAINDFVLIGKDLMLTFGAGGLVPLVDIGVLGVKKLIDVIKSSGKTDYTPDEIIALAAQLKAEDDALDMEFKEE